MIMPMGKQLKDQNTLIEQSPCNHIVGFVCEVLICENYGKLVQFNSDWI